MRSLVIFFCAVLSSFAIDDYELTPDSLEQPGVPKGRVEHYSWTSEIFPGTVRDYWVYVPAQYDPDRPACVMVVQDGLGRARDWKLIPVLDNLIYKNDIPVIIGIFIDPGVVPAPNDEAQPRFNRSFEYDALGDRYARFLLEEILPEVGKKYNLSDDPNDQSIAGASSGAICAFNVAWERPDAFRRVLSTIGTYVGLRGGQDFPVLVRKTEPKPIRVFLQDGENDLNLYAGKWWVANHDMFAALEWAGYDVKAVWGDGGHTGKHAAAIMPEALRWLWRDYPAPIQANLNTEGRRIDILIPGEDWELVSEGYGFTEGPTVNGKGEVFFTDIDANKIYRIDLEGKVSVFAENTGGANGLMFGTDGNLYACANGKKQIVAYAPDGSSYAVVENVTSNDLVLLDNNRGYFTDPGNHNVYYFDSESNARIVDTGIEFPNGVTASPDQSLLYVADMRGRFVYSFQIQPNGSLKYKQPFFHLHIPYGETATDADGMAIDEEGRLYVATNMGIQVCDQPGRVNFIISKPQKGWLANAVFGGPDLNYLYVTASDKVYRRKTKTRGFRSWQTSIKPPKPRL